MGNNKEPFDVEVFAIHQALKIFEARQESSHKYTVFSDSRPVIRRALTDALGPGQQWARAIFEVATRVTARGNEIRHLWVPAHKELAGNEFADGLAKGATEGRPRDALEEVPNRIR